MYDPVVGHVPGGERVLCDVSVVRLCVFFTVLEERAAEDGRFSEFVIVVAKFGNEVVDQFGDQRAGR